MLYRRPNSRKWCVRFTTPNGKEVRQSTGTEDKNTAEAEEYEAQLKQEPWREERRGQRHSHAWQESMVRWIAPGATTAPERLPTRRFTVLGGQRALLPIAAALLQIPNLRLGGS